MEKEYRVSINFKECFPGSKKSESIHSFQSGYGWKTFEIIDSHPYLIPVRPKGDPIFYINYHEEKRTMRFSIEALCRGYQLHYRGHLVYQSDINLSLDQFEANGVDVYNIHSGLKILIRACNPQK